MQPLAEAGDSSLCFEIFNYMRNRSMDIGEPTLTRLLKACRVGKDLRRGEQLHQYIININNMDSNNSINNNNNNNIAQNSYLLSGLIRMYGACNQLTKASEVFQRAIKVRLLACVSRVTFLGSCMLLLLCVV